MSGNGYNNGYIKYPGNSDARKIFSDARKSHMLAIETYRGKTVEKKL